MTVLYPGNSNYVGYGLTNVGGTLFFQVYDNAHGGELWKSNGTSSGTQLVAETDPGGTTSQLFDLTNIDGTLFFTANGTELWKSDGTSTGTEMVADVGQAGADLLSFTNVEGTLYFVTDKNSSDYELWKSDGTSSGTQLVAELDPGRPVNGPQELTNVGGTLYFTFNDGTHGPQLWKSDGTSSGTQMAGDIADISTSIPGLGLGDLTNVDGTLFFNVSDAVHGAELWEIPSPFLAPSVTGATTPENIQTQSGLVITLNAADLGAATNFQISDITGGTLYLNDGVTPIADNAFITVAQGAAGLKFTPALNSRAGSFAVQSSSNAATNGLGGPTTNATIMVTPTADIPSLLAPSGAVTSTMPTFQWSPAANAAGYYVAIKDDTTDTYPLLPTKVTNPYYIPTITFVPGQLYEWGVQGFNSSGQTGLWTNSAFFGVNIPSGVGASTLLAPLGTVTTTTPTFRWSAINGADGYFLAVKDDTTGSYPIAPTFVSGTSYTPNFDFLESHSYEWGVQAVGAMGRTGSWTISSFFNVPIIVGTAALVGPSGVVASPAFQWSPVVDATGYYIAVKDDTINTYPIPPTAVTGTSYVPGSPLVVGHEYEWGVQAFNAKGKKGNWTSSQPFSVISLGVPTLDSPSGALSSDNSPTFVWSAVPARPGITSS